jgi:hypothetical protein
MALDRKRKNYKSSLHNGLALRLYIPKGIELIEPMILIMGALGAPPQTWGGIF